MGVVQGERWGADITGGLQCVPLSLEGRIFEFLACCIIRNATLKLELKIRKITTMNLQSSMAAAFITDESRGLFLCH